MRKKIFLLIFIAVFLALSVCWQASYYWGSLYTPPTFTSFSLVEFDKKVSESAQDCFSMQAESNFGSEMEQDFVVSANNSILLRKQIDVSKNPLVTECIPSESLSQGDNFIEIRLGPERLFYHVEKIASLEKKVSVLSAEYEGSGNLKINVSNSDDSRYSPIEIFVNQALDHRVYFSGESFSTTEKIFLQPGTNSVKVSFEGKEILVSAEKEQAFAMNPIIGLLVLSALFCVLAFLVFFEKGIFERIALSALSFFAVFCTVFFVLNISGLLSAFNFALSIILLTAVIALFFRKNFSRQDNSLKINWKKTAREISPLLFVLVGIIVFSSLFFNLFTSTYFGTWTSFYERQSREIMQAQAIPSLDSYSFLGTKEFGYMSGYFFIEPGVSWLTGLAIQQSYAIVMILAQIAFVASAILFFRSYSLGKKAYLAAIVCLLGGFLFSDFSFNIRHVISYSFLFFSMFLLRKNNGLGAGIALGFGVFFQTPIALMFLALMPVVAKRDSLKELAKALAIGALIAGIFFAPTIISSGLPSQAKSDVWGYLWSIPLYGFVLDYMSIILLIGIFIVPFLLLKKTKFDSFSLRVLFLLIIFLLIQLYVSYRVNIVATITFALLIGLIFPKDFFRERLTEYSLAAFFAIGFSFMFIIIMSFYPVNPQTSESFVFAKMNSSTNANFLNEPWLGHPFIFYAERKSTADLAVEYANEQMIDDSYSFIKQGSLEILKKYKIDYVINRSIFLDEKPVGSNLYSKLMEYPALDKVFSNSLIYIHWVDRGRIK